MNFTRKRPRTEGDYGVPPAKRPDTKDTTASRSNPSTPVQPTLKAPPPAQPVKIDAPKPVSINTEPSKSYLEEEIEDVPIDEVCEADLIRRDQLLNDIENLRSIATLLVERALKLGSESSSSDTEVEKLTKSGYIQLISMKSSHRILQSRIETRKEKTISVDSDAYSSEYHALKSLEYEKTIFKRIIDNQMSLDEATDLISEEDFKAYLLSQKDADSMDHSSPVDEDRHKFTIDRLKHEFEQRKILSNKLKEIPAKKEELKRKLVQQNQTLNRMKDNFKDTSNSFNQMRIASKIESCTEIKVNPSSLYLPQPLYNLYIQLTSWISVYGPIFDVTISGPVESAKKAPQKNLSNLPLTASQAQLKHPLSVLMTFKMPNSKQIGFRFEYLINLCFVVVTPTEGEDPRILAELYPNDFGNQSPNWNTKLIVNNGTQFLPHKSKAYKWVQFLCGLHFYPGPHEITETADLLHISTASSNHHLEKSLKSSTSNQTLNGSEKNLKSLKSPEIYSFTDIIELLKRRVQSRFALMNVISNLCIGKFEIETKMKPTLVNQSTTITKFNEIPTKTQLQSMIKEMRQYNSNVELDDNNFETNTFYTATFAFSGSKQTITIISEIHPNYPYTKPNIWMYSNSIEVDKNELLKIEEAVQTKSLKSFEVSTYCQIEDVPEKLLVILLSYIRDCLNIMFDIQKHGKDSKFFEDTNRYETSSWACTE